MRSYTIGLPVTVDIHDDGTVTFEVDLSEAGDDLADGVPTDKWANALYSERTIEHDEIVVSAATATINQTFKITTNPTA